MTKANIPGWNDRATIHLRDATGFYNIEGFKAGADTLLPVEAAEVGDVTGLRVAHLQCHFGLDTLSLARRGAKATGLDFSSVAIEGARKLAAETGLEATFVQSDVYAARKALGGEYDLVYVTWGAINWLPDIARWGAVIATLLKPGGRFYMAEIHPSAYVLAESAYRYVVNDNWRTPITKPLVSTEPLTYTGDPTPLDNPVIRQWAHPLSAIVMSLIDAGLRLDFLREHEFLPYRMFPSMIEVERQSFRLPEGAPIFPLSFSLSATKQGV